MPMRARVLGQCVRACWDHRRACTVARQPLPPQVICKILGMDEETVKAAFEKGEPPTASKEQLLDAVPSCVCVYGRARDGRYVCVCTRATATANFLGMSTLQTRSVGAVVAKLANKIWSHVVENVDSLWAHAYKGKSWMATKGFLHKGKYYTI